MPLPKVFVDSDVIISSLISEKGAAFFLITEKHPKVKFLISNLSLKEQRIVADRLKINEKGLQNLIGRRFTIVQLKGLVTKLKRKYQEYTIDPYDAHIVAGAHKAKAKFLITYNRRHFNEDKIKKDFNIILFTPAQFLQYLRTRSEA